MTAIAAEARRLLALADADRRAFEWLLQGPGLRPAAAFFFAQQAIEKALKAIMLLKGLTPSRTHNLLALAAEMAAAGCAPPVAADDLAALNPYAVTLRYDDEDISTLDADEARRWVGLVLGWASGILELEGRE